MSEVVEKKVEEKKPTVSNSSRLMLLVSRLNKMIENLPPAESDFVISTLASLRSVEAQKAYRERQFSDFHAKLEDKRLAGMMNALPGDPQ